MDRSERKKQPENWASGAGSSRQIEESSGKQFQNQRSRPQLHNLKSIPFNQDNLQGSGSPSRNNQGSPLKSGFHGAGSQSASSVHQQYYFKGSANHLDPPKYYAVDKGPQIDSIKKRLANLRAVEYSLSGFNTTDGLSSRILRTQSDLQNLSTKHLSSHDPYSPSFLPLSAREEAFKKHRLEVIKTELELADAQEVNDLEKLFTEADRMISTARSIRKQFSVATASVVTNKTGAPELDANTKIKQLYFEYENLKDVMDPIMLSPAPRTK